MEYSQIYSDNITNKKNFIYGKSLEYLNLYLEFVAFDLHVNCIFR